MAKQSQMDRAIEEFERQKAILQKCIDELKAQQGTPKLRGLTRKPRSVKRATESESA